MIKFDNIHLFSNSGRIKCFSCEFKLSGLGEVKMRDFKLSDKLIQMLESELTMQIMQRLGRDFGEVFNEKKAVHSNGYQAQEVLPVQESSSASVADMCGSESVSSNMP